MTIRSGLVQTRNRPGGNVTGASVYSGSQLGPKHLELLHELVPMASKIALLVNPANAKQTEGEITEVKPAARKLGVDLSIIEASSDVDFEKAFATAAEEDATALIVGADPLFVSKAKELVGLAARHAIPAILRIPCLCCARRLDELRTQLARGIPAGRNVCRTNFEG